MKKHFMQVFILSLLFIPISVLADGSDSDEDIERINEEISPIIADEFHSDDFIIEEIEQIDGEIFSHEEGDFHSDDEFILMEEMISKWEKDAYPDFVGHVYYDQDTDKYLIGLVNTDSAEAEELIATVKDKDGIEIESAKFAYNDLLKVQESITEDMVEQSEEAEGIHGVAVGWTTIDGKVSGFGDSGKEFRVVVIVDENSYDKYVEKFDNAYGEMVYVEAGEGFTTFEDDSAEDGSAMEASLISEENNQLWIYLSLFVIVCAVIIFFMINYQRKTSAKQTTNGQIVTSSQLLSEKEVEYSIRKSGIQPSEEVRKNIISEIKKEQ